NVLDKKDSLGTSVSGYMPRGYNCGFIYEGGSLHTVAHELGHGVGNLEHAFSASNNSGKTQNLMDYSTGEELYHFQWNEIQDPSRVWLKWRKDESEGEIKIGRTDFDTKFYIICISNRDTLFYEAGENIYLLKNSKYKFEIIKRHNFLFGNVMCSTDFKFNNVSWNNNEKKSIYEINTSTYNSEVLKAQIFGDEKIIGYLSNDNKFIRVNDKSLIPNNSKYIEVDANKLGIIEKSDITIISNIILIDRPIVEFVRNKNYQGEYGFDNDFWTENEKTIHYNKIKINGIDYNIPWLSAKTGQEIRINAIINAKNKNIPASTIMFEGEDAEISVVNSLKNINNVINIKPGIVNNFELKVKFLSNNSFDTPKKIYAKLDSETIGCLYYFSTDNFKEANLIIHPFFVNNNYYTEININKIQSYLNNNSFNQSFVYWNVTLCPNDFKNSKIESLISLYKPNLDYPSVNNKNKIAEDLINGVTNQYNSGVILDFIKDYFCFEQMNLNNNDYVLFVTDIEPNNGSEDGIAEQHNPWSVIFKNGINNYSTYVHEITHCIGFNHTFEEKDSKSFGGRGKKVSKNSTENFMDYSDSKIMFWKSDWVDINLNINRK
ncbi:MAG: hypothetical protein MJ211_12220, partial [Bacteroidales bacterium]|nr:hypothetical protein [Bacteroidales bacterium]